MSSSPDLYFCQLLTLPLEEALKKLLLRSLQRGWHALVVVPDTQKLGTVDEELWSVPHEWILPHGLSQSPNSKKLPICLSTTWERPNQAEVVFLCDGSWLDLQPETLSTSAQDQAQHAGIQRFCLMLEAHQPTQHTDHARQLWQSQPEGRRQHVKM